MKTRGLGVQHDSYFNLYVTTIYQLLISLGLFVKDKGGIYVLSWG